MIKKNLDSQKTPDYKSKVTEWKCPENAFQGQP